MEKDGVSKMDRQNKKCSCARKSGRRKNNAGTDEEEEKKQAEGCSRRNGKQGRRFMAEEDIR